MIIHVNPYTQREHRSSFFREKETTDFFTFDGKKYLKDGTIKYWIYGHTHDAMEYICNPLGYPSEGNSMLKSIDINKIIL